MKVEKYYPWGSNWVSTVIAHCYYVSAIATCTCQHAEVGTAIVWWQQNLQLASSSRENLTNIISIWNRPFVLSQIAHISLLLDDQSTITVYYLHVQVLQSCSIVMHSHLQFLTSLLSDVCCLSLFSFSDRFIDENFVNYFFEE